MYFVCFSIARRRILNVLCRRFRLSALVVESPLRLAATHICIDDRAVGFIDDLVAVLRCFDIPALGRPELCFNVGLAAA